MARLAIGDTGRVDRCDIVRSTGDGDLDATTCRVLQRRGRYGPSDPGKRRVVLYRYRWSFPR